MRRFGRETSNQYQNQPPIDFENLTTKQIDRYNVWIGSVRMWCNLILIQQEKLTREEACLPRCLKSYPGFPGSQYNLQAQPIGQALSALESAAPDPSGEAPQRFKNLKPEIWRVIQERFSPPEHTEQEKNQSPAPSARLLPADLRRW